MKTARLSGLILGAMLLGAAPSGAQPGAGGIAGDAARSARAGGALIEPVLSRRCPRGYRRTIGGCMRIRQSWWARLFGL